MSIVSTTTDIHDKDHSDFPSSVGPELEQKTGTDQRSQQTVQSPHSHQCDWPVFPNNLRVAGLVSRLQYLTRCRERYLSSHCRRRQSKPHVKGNLQRALHVPSIQSAEETCENVGLTGMVS